MDSLLDAIRAGVASDATDDARSAAAAACRTILSALEAQAGEPLATPTAAAPDAMTIATAIGALRNVPPEQLLDLAIARLRAALPPETAVPAVQPVKFHVVTLPRLVPPKAAR